VTKGACILVTGGAGYIGSLVCKALSLAGYRVLALDDLSSGERRAARFGPLHVFDLGDEAKLGALLDAEPVEAVIHLAGLIDQPASFAAPKIYHAANVVTTQRLLAAMAARGIDRLVFASSAAVYGDRGQATPAAGISERQAADPASPYGRSKLAVERLLAAAEAENGLRFLSFRFFNAAGADPDGDLGENHRVETHLIPLAIRAACGLGPALTLHGADFPTADGTAIRDYVHVTDLAQAHVTALERLHAGAESMRLNLGTGRGHSVRAVIRMIEEVGGCRVPSTEGPRRPGDPPELVAASGRARELLGWTPRHSDLRNIVATAWAWHVAKAARKRVAAAD